MIHGKKNFLNLRTYDNIPKITTGQGDGCTTGCLLDFCYFKEYYEMIAIHLNEEIALDADRIATQQINFIGNLD